MLCRQKQRSQYYLTYHHLHLILYNFLKKVRGFDELWFIGDSFIASTYRRNFKKVGHDQLYCKRNFEVTAFCSSRFSDSNNNVLSRVVNTAAEAINKNIKLPKFIVVVLDTDLIEYLNYKNYGVSGMLGSWLEYLAKELDNMIRVRLEQLPDKARRSGEPFVYWASLPIHANFGDDNHVRSKFNVCLDSVVRMYGGTMRVMKLIEHWKKDDSNLVSLTGRITEYGYNRYWRSLDSAIRFNIQKREDFLTRSCQKKKREFTTMTEGNSGFPLHQKRPRRGDRFILLRPNARK